MFVQTFDGASDDLTYIPYVMKHSNGEQSLQNYFSQVGLMSYRDAGVVFYL